MYTTFVGIDISKKTFDACILNSQALKPKYLKLNMSSDDFEELVLNLYEHEKQSTLIVMESTGSYHFTLLSFLLSNDFNVSVVNPYLINNFIKADTLRKTKNDKKDALAIANFAARSFDRIKLIEGDFLDSPKSLCVKEKVFRKISQSSKPKVNL